MKLSSFFVAAMVVASVNAGLIDKSKVEDIAPQTTEQSLSSASHAMLALVRKQKEDHPSLDHILNNDPSHNNLLIVLLRLQNKILGLASQIESELTKHHSQTKSTGSPNSDYSYKKFTGLLGQIDECLMRFDTTESIYLYEYPTSTTNLPILSFENLNELVNIVKMPQNGSPWWK
ncbi:hypothetical protein BASA50_010413 [Batrachochytrium salamandrivorans]|uniref:Uncharacterized protein n=1 Tax=Batrachochytrium salamandrivorans TaxID=1357716 RepID=A0ABQ8EZ06_9FUNG|nr:hypothetical protein BASA50_010413 [Batrachochytrium salamandrivorans]